MDEQPKVKEFLGVDFSKDFLPIAIASSFSASTKAYAESKTTKLLTF
jgi:hypothetical protein